MVITYTIAPVIAHLLDVQELVRLWCESPDHRDERPPAWLLDELVAATDAARAKTPEEGA